MPRRSRPCACVMSSPGETSVLLAVLPMKCSSGGWAAVPVVPIGYAPTNSGSLRRDYDPPRAHASLLPQMGSTPFTGAPRSSGRLLWQLLLPTTTVRLATAEARYRAARFTRFRSTHHKPRSCEPHPLMIARRWISAGYAAVCDVLRPFRPRPVPLLMSTRGVGQPTRSDPRECDSAGRSIDDIRCMT